MCLCVGGMHVCGVGRWVVMCVWVECSVCVGRWVVVCVCLCVCVYVVCVCRAVCVCVCVCVGGIGR